jgi:hypothetical protein
MDMAQIRNAYKILVRIPERDPGVHRRIIWQGKVGPVLN